MVPYLEYSKWKDGKVKKEGQGKMFRSAYFVLWSELKIQNGFGK